MPETQSPRRPRVAIFRSTRREDLFVGRVETEGLEELVATLKRARTERKGLVFFLWVRSDGFALTVGVDEPQPSRSAPGYRPIRDQALRGEAAADDENGDEAPRRPRRASRRPAPPEASSGAKAIQSVFDELDNDDDSVPW